MAITSRKYGTNFFECYAQISLRKILGEKYADLVNLDRPDLQSPDGKSLGIEVTRAMEESKNAAQMLIKEMSGIVPREESDEDYEEIIKSGYAYGLHNGKYIGNIELPFWSLAQPLTRILQSKISKAINGFYGDFDSLRLYIFCKDPLSDADVLSFCKYAMDQQGGSEAYDTIYLSEIDQLHVCNMKDNVSSLEDRVATYTISPEQRREFYFEALIKQLE